MLEHALTVEEIDDSAIISLPAVTDLKPADAERVLSEALATVRGTVRRSVVVELRGVLHLSPPMERTLLAMQQSASTSGRTLALTGVTPELQRVFRIRGFDKLFRVYATRQAAVSESGSRPQEPGTSAA